MYFSRLLSLSALLLAARATDEHVHVIDAEVLETEVLEERAVRAKDDACPKGPGPTLVVGPLIVYFPVKINNYYEENTIININGGPTININNAPVYINTIVTASSTVTTTSTVTVNPSASASSAVPNSAPFFLTINTIVVGKRQSGFNLLTVDGTSTSDCSAAALFATSSDGGLFSDGQRISANPLATSELFSFKATGGSVNTGFSLINGVLNWYNPLFIVEEVLFCLLNGLVNAIFNGILPTGCIAVALDYLDLSRCHNNATAPITLPSTTFSSSTSAAYTNSTTASSTITSFSSTTGTAYSSYTGVYSNATHT